jgi:hypothetical protein
MASKQAQLKAQEGEQALSEATKAASKGIFKKPGQKKRKKKGRNLICFYISFISLLFSDFEKSGRFIRQSSDGISQRETV